MIEIINKPINDLFYNLVSDSKKTIRLCAPYVKQDIVNNIYVNKRKNVKIDFISNFSIPNFYKRSSDIEAFKTVMDWEDKVYNCQKLHAKFYIFDDKHSIITSSNLTSSGFKKNLEYGVFMNDTHLVNKMLTDFKNICDDKNTGRINSQKVIHIEKILKNLPIYKDIDFENYNKHTEVDDILDVDIELIKRSLNSWKRTTFEVVDIIKKNEFSLDDIYVYEELFSKKYPDNNTIKARDRKSVV